MEHAFDDGEATSPPSSLEVTVSCPNCGHAIGLHYCPNCGQHKSDHETKLWHFITEFLGEFIRFDSKLLRTLDPLFREPGKLTKEWVVGKRARYITPLKIYVTASAIAFFALNFAVSQRAATVIAINGTPAASSKPLHVRKEDGPVMVLIETGIVNLRNEDPKLVLEQSLSRLPTSSLLIVPLMACFMWLLYIRSHRSFMEHLVFVLHYNSFCFLILTLRSFVPINIVGLLGFLWVSIYLALAVKRNYSQGWGKSLVKSGILGIVSLFIVGLTLAANLIVTGLSTPDLVTKSKIHQTPR